MDKRVIRLWQMIYARKQSKNSDFHQGGENEKTWYTVVVWSALRTLDHCLTLHWLNDLNEARNLIWCQMAIGLPSKTPWHFVSPYSLLHIFFFNRKNEQQDMYCTQVYSRKPIKPMMRGEKRQLAHELCILLHWNVIMWPRP